MVTSDIGANPSAEEGGDEGTDDQKQTVIDIVDSFKLTNTPMDKKGYVVALKSMHAPSTSPFSQL